MYKRQGEIDSDIDYVFVDAPNRLVAHERLKMEMRITLVKAIVDKHQEGLQYTDILEHVNVMWNEIHHYTRPTRDILNPRYILDSIYLETKSSIQYSRFLDNHILPVMAVNGGIIFCYDHEYEEQHATFLRLGRTPILLNTTKHPLSHDNYDEVHINNAGDINFITELMGSLIISQNIETEHAKKALTIMDAYASSPFVLSDADPTHKLLSQLTTENLISAFNSLSKSKKQSVAHCMLDVGVDVFNGYAASSSMVTIESTPLGELLHAVTEIVGRIFNVDSSSLTGMSFEELLEQNRPVMIIVSSENDDDKHSACVAASAIKSILLSKIRAGANSGWHTNNKSERTLCFPHDTDFLPRGFWNITDLLSRVYYGIVAGGDNQRDPNKESFHAHNHIDMNMLLANVDTLGCYVQKNKGLSGMFRKREFQPALYSKRHANNILSVANLDMSEEPNLKESNISALLLK